MNIDTDDLIDNSFVISVDDTKLVLFKIRFDIFGRCPKIYRGFTLKNGDYYHLAGIRKKNNIINCTLSHMGIVRMAMTIGLPYVCIFEEDACPHNDIINKLGFYLSNIPDDIDCIRLGTCNKNGEYVRNIDNRFRMSYYVWGSQAQIIFQKYYKKYLELIDIDPISDGKCLNNIENKIYITNDLLFLQNSYKNTNRLHQDTYDVPIKSFGKEYIQQNFGKYMI